MSPTAHPTNDNARAPRGVLVGYARVSTPRQRLDLQLDALRDAGCALVYEDTASGSDPDRRGLRQAIAFCQRGDALVVWRLDRLGRSVAHLGALFEVLRRRGIALRVLSSSGDDLHDRSPEARLLLGVLGLFAEFERELARERTTAGTAAANRRVLARHGPQMLSPATWACLTDAFNGTSMSQSISLELSTA